MANKSPMRKILYERVADGYPYQLNTVYLECGHTAYSNAQFKAHCKRCRDGKPQDFDPKDFAKSGK